MSIKRVSIAALMAALMLLGSTGAAFAAHTHVRLLGNGQCVILAADGGEQDVELPHADGHDEGKRHPLHVKVHLGNPGMRGDQHVVFVKGSTGDLENCNGYVNG